MIPGRIGRTSGAASPSWIWPTAPWQHTDIKLGDPLSREHAGLSLVHHARTIPVGPDPRTQAKQTQVSWAHLGRITDYRRAGRRGGNWGRRSPRPLVQGSWVVISGKRPLPPSDPVTAGVRTRFASAAGYVPPAFLGSLWPHFQRCFKRRSSRCGPACTGCQDGVVLSLAAASCGAGLPAAASAAPSAGASAAVTPAAGTGVTNKAMTGITC